MPWNYGETSGSGCGFKKFAAIHRIRDLSASHRMAKYGVSGSSIAW
jgi:hypothetical protein